MRKINVAICDDEKYFLEDTLKYLEVYANEYTIEMDIMKFSTGIALLEDGREYDIVFLDVEMPEKDGVSTARELQKKYHNTVVCFITSHEGYALRAYEVEAIGYIVKPVKYTEFKNVMEKAIVLAYHNIDKVESEKRYIDLFVNRNKVVVDTKKIIYIEKCNNRCRILTKEGEMVCYETISNLYGRLDKGEFILVHQGYIVNFQEIKEVKRNRVFMGHGVEIPVSRKFYEHVKQKHTDKINMLLRDKR